MYPVVPVLFTVANASSIKGGEEVLGGLHCLNSQTKTEERLCDFLKLSHKSQHALSASLSSPLDAEFGNATSIG